MQLRELLEYLNLNEFVALDIETTGLDSQNDAITEISAYRFKDGKPGKNYTTLVNPGVKIPPNIIELTGINNRMVRNAPVIDQVLPDLRDFIGDSPVVGHNVSFDLNFLNRRFLSTDLKRIDEHIYDTLSLSRAFLFFHHEFTLSAIARFFQLDTENAHRASADTLNTGKIFCQLIHEAASYPLAVIQVMYQTVKHADIYNLELFKNLVEVSLQLKLVDGLTTSSLSKNSRSFIFRHASSTNESNLTDSPATWLTENGIISKNWPDYESRSSQIELAEDTCRAFTDNTLMLAEAGTGLGKSLAYLSAGVIHRKKSDVPLLVSTYTKNLQDQLFYSDIPKLTEVIDLDISAILVKGRNNYICFTRLDNILANSSNSLNKTDCENILPILIWREFTQTGDISECHGFKIRVASKLWSMIRSEKGYCTTYRCNSHDGCFVGKIRENIHKADIIVVNHALLLIDSLQENTILPDAYTYVIDEGHNLEQAARDQLVYRISDYSFIDLLKVFSGKETKFTKALSRLTADHENIGNICDDLEGITTQLGKQVSEFFSYYADSKREGMNEHPQYEYRVIYKSADEEFDNIQPKPEEITASLTAFRQAMNLLYDSSRNIDHDDIAYIIQEIELLTDKISSLITTWKRCIEVESEDVVWSSCLKQRESIQVSLNCAPRDVSRMISDGLFSGESGGLICSATLTVEDNFEYLKSCLGIDRIEHSKEVKEKIYYSPFLYEDQVKLFIGTGNASVQSREYLHGVSIHIDKLSREIPGRMLVLCTSYAQTRVLQEFLIQSIRKDEERKLFVQNSGRGRQALIQGYLTHARAILIGTASFWEGVDFPGDHLKMLVIIKLPFANPGDPIVKAKIDEFNNSGRNAFMDFQVPDATVKLKQGFGRLIRSLDDTGICLITDPRLSKARYGRIMLDSLPVESKPYLMIDSVIRASRKFLA